MSRGDRREDIYPDEVDRHDFIKTLAEACQKTGCWGSMVLRQTRRRDGRNLNKEWRRDDGKKPMRTNGLRCGAVGIGEVSRFGKHGWSRGRGSWGRIMPADYGGRARRRGTNVRWMRNRGRPEMRSAITWFRVRPARGFGSEQVRIRIDAWLSAIFSS